MYINLCNHTLDLKKEIEVGIVNMIPLFIIGTNEQSNDKQGQSTTLLRKK